MISSFLNKKLEEEYHYLNLWYFVSFMAGIIVFFKIISNKFSLSELVVIGLIFVVITCFFYQRNLIIYFISFCVLAFIAGLFVSNIRLNSIQVDPIKKNIIANLQGEVESLKPTLRGVQVVLIDNVSDTKRDFHKIRVNISNKLSLDLRPGDVISLKAKLFPLQTSILPGSYDFGFYMRMSGIEASGYALTPPKIISANYTKFSQYIKVKRRQIYERLLSVMGNKKGNFAAAILIGETRAIPQDISENMRNSGVAHILSVSGLHLSLVAMIFFVCSRVLLNSSNFLAYNTNIKIISAIISITGSFLYLQISGNNIAATRAFIMTTIFITSIMFDRSPHPLRSVMIAAFLILCFLPEYIFHPSFQLSFAAVLCLISGYEIYLRNRDIFGKSKGVFSSIKFYIFTNIYSSFLASIVTAPFVIYHFYKFANYSVIMNLIAVPLMSFFMMPLALLAILLMPIGFDSGVLNLLGFFISVIVDFAEYIVHQPFAISYIGHITELSLITFAFGFFWLCLWQTRWRMMGVFIMFLGCGMIYTTKTPSFLYDHNIKAAAVNNKKNGLLIYSNDKMQKFTLDYWSGWFGFKEADITETRISNKDSLFLLNSGHLVALNYTKCQKADIGIVVSKKLKCKGDNIVLNSDLQKNSKVMVYCSPTEDCKIKLF